MAKSAAPLADFVISARNIKTSGNKQVFGSENTDQCAYLLVPDGEDPSPAHAVDYKARLAWAKQVRRAARQGVTGDASGNILVFVHGYNGSLAINMRRHRQLRDDLAKANFNGVVVSFDWPCGDVGAFYLEDMKDAHDASHQLVKDGIMLLAELQEPECKVNVHILAHSMGAYVTGGAFSWADDVANAAGASWHISQIMLIAGDISSRSLRPSDHRSEGIYRACTRLTTYQSRHDKALDLSNIKRVGVAPRVGRVGLPDEAPAHAVNVDCSDYWKSIEGTVANTAIGDPTHSWHIGDPVFTADMISTMSGVDRSEMPTRKDPEKNAGKNRFELTVPPAS